MNNDIIMNDDDKFELVEEDEKLLREEEATSMINDVANRVYALPRHDGELNLYKHILDSIVEDDDKDSVSSLFDTIEPDLINKNDIVQKIIISSLLLNKLLLLKHTKKDIDIFRITKGIRFRDDTLTWLNVMVQYTIPILLNNNLIKELKDV